MPIKSMFTLFVRKIWYFSYDVTILAFWPLNMVLTQICKNKAINNSVLHISYMVHVPYHTTRILRLAGMKADYLAKGFSPVWNKCDYHAPAFFLPFFQAFMEFLQFWQVVVKYGSVHLHFALTMSHSGWELPFLKKMGRKIVVHYRGCEVRDYHQNIRLHPDMNICQECDYDRYCISESNILRVKRVSKYADTLLVTTPDMKDFVPEAMFMPFFCPILDDLSQHNQNVKLKYPERPLRILHWTNHPGIEGTCKIISCIESLQNKGYLIEFKILKGVPHSVVMDEIFWADLTIGKMKMGYYANSQIESMVRGVPAITWIRPDLVTEELSNSGFIISHLDELENTLKYYLDNPKIIENKKKIAKSSILKLHNNINLANRYKEIYLSLS